MIETLIFGRVCLKIEGFNLSIMTDRLTHACKVISLYTKNDAIYLTVSGLYERRVKRICESSGCVCEVIKKSGAIYKFSGYFKRFGIYFGVLLAAALIIYLSNTVVQIEIRGSSDEALNEEIRSILGEQGLKPGAYIPSLNFLKLSAYLFEESDNIAWASIGNSGSVVYVNVTESTNKISAENMRMPCNILSEEDAVIVDAKVMVGRLEVLLGDAVHKGQLLVSGIIERPDVSTRYFHAYAKITGRYEKTAEFRQDYVEEAVVSGNTVYRSNLCFFELELPLPGKRLNKDSAYSVKTQTTPVKLFGLTLPFSVKRYEYTERITDIKRYSTAEAISEVYRRLDNYEKSILSDKKIVSRDVECEQSERGIELRVHYVLEGEIGRASEIFIK